jgi:hypothetical protein
MDVIGMSFVNSANRSVARIDMQAIQHKHASDYITPVHQRSISLHAGKFHVSIRLPGIYF